MVTRTCFDNYLRMYSVLSTVSLRVQTMIQLNTVDRCIYSNMAIGIPLQSLVIAIVKERSKSDRLIRYVGEDR